MRVIRSSMYTQQILDDLISCPKKISESPKHELRLTGAHWKNDMKLTSDSCPGEFRVFFRKSEDFPENFSIGLSYDQHDGTPEIVLLRCNGQHGIFNGSLDPQHPHWDYHIHRASTTAIERAEKFAETTRAYSSYGQAVQYFLKLINLDAGQAAKFFPNESQGRLWFDEGLNNGHS